MFIGQKQLPQIIIGVVGVLYHIKALSALIRKKRKIFQKGALLSRKNCG